MSSLHFAGIDTDRLHQVVKRGIDDAGNAIESFVAPDGGWTLRCCLRNAVAGDEIAIIAWSPFPWRGAYAETGPIVVHTAGCNGAERHDTLPADLDSRAMVLRPYNFENRIAYHHVRHIAAGDSLTSHLEELLAESDVDFVHGRNVTGGCYAFTASTVG